MVSISVLDKLSKECGIGDPLELFYADDLALTAETKKNSSVFGKWKYAMVRRGVKINIAKTKLLMSDKPLIIKQKTRRHH